MSCGSSGSMPAGLVAHRGLQSRQREIGVGAAEHRPREGEPFGVAAAGGALDLRSAGIGQAEHLCHLVEGFAHGVVDGGAEPDIVADADHGDDLGVAAGGQEQAIGKRQRAGQPRRQRVGLEMVDRDQRRIVHHRDRLRGGEADDHAADQPGARRRPRPPKAARSRRRPPSSRCRRCRRARRHGRAPRSPAPRRRTAACSSVCERTILDRMRPDPSLRRSTTAAAVSSQVVSIPSTSIRRVVIQFEPLRYRPKRRLPILRVALRGRKVQSSVAAERPGQRI